VSRMRVLVSLALLPALAQAQESSHTLAGPEAAIYNLAGEVTIGSGSGSSVQVTVSRIGRDAAQLKVESGELGGRQTLRVLYPSDRIVYPALGRSSSTNLSVRDDGTWGGDHGRGWRNGGSHRVSIRGDGDGLEAAADLRVSIPAGKRVAVYLGVGKVDVSNVDGDLTVDVSSATIASRGTRGRLVLDTGSGDIHVESAEGDLDLDTGSGDVSVHGFRNGPLRIDTGSGDVTGGDVDTRELHVDTGSGGIHLTRVTAPRLSLDTGSGDVSIELTNSPEMAEVETGSGDVTLRLPAEASATVDLDTSSGDLTIDFPMQLLKKSDSNIRGRIGSGEGRISVETGSGDISLLK
jgi:lia operon protein LiaG